MKEKLTTPESRVLRDEEIERAAIDDPDSFVPDPQWIRNARIVTPGRKEVVTLRLDSDVLEWFRHDGKGYQTRINAVLRAFVGAQR